MHRPLGLAPGFWYVLNVWPKLCQEMQVVLSSHSQKHCASGCAEPEISLVSAGLGDGFVTCAPPGDTERKGNAFVDAQVSKASSSPLCVKFVRWEWYSRE